MAIEKTCILIVDDASENIDVLRSILGDEYKLKVALNGKKALDLAKRDPKPDFKLLLSRF
jgi:putative two-component system response regulator